MDDQVGGLKVQSQIGATPPMSAVGLPVIQLRCFKVGRQCQLDPRPTACDANPGFVYQAVQVIATIRQVTVPELPLQQGVIADKSCPVGTPNIEFVIMSGWEKVTPVDRVVRNAPEGTADVASTG